MEIFIEEIIDLPNGKGKGSIQFQNIFLYLGDLEISFPLLSYSEHVLGLDSVLSVVSLTLSCKR